MTAKTYTRAQLDAAAIKFAAIHVQSGFVLYFLKHYAEAVAAWDGQSGPSYAEMDIDIVSQWIAFLASEYPRYFINFRTREGTNPAFIETNKATFDRLCNGHIAMTRPDGLPNFIPQYWVYHGRGTSPEGDGEYVEMIEANSLAIEPDDEQENFVKGVDRPSR